MSDKKKIIDYKKIKTLKKHNHYYYNRLPQISDQEYDQLKKEISSLEENNGLSKS